MLEMEEVLAISPATLTVNNSPKPISKANSETALLSAQPNIIA